MNRTSGWTRQFPILSVKSFLLIFCFVIIPLSSVFVYVKVSYEKYLKEEISNKIIQSIAKGEENVYAIFQEMANLSNALVFNGSLSAALADSDSSYYDNALAVDRTIAELNVNALSSMQDVIVTLIDREGRLYTNWARDFDNYDFLVRQDWVQESIRQQGHIVWNLFSPAYMAQDANDEKYISLARSMLSNGVTGDYLASVLISVKQQKLSRLLLQYAYDQKDYIYVSDAGGQVVFKYDDKNAVSREQLLKVLEKTNQAERGSTVLPINGQPYLISYYSLASPWVSEGRDLKIIHFTNYEDIARQLSQISNWMNIGLGATFALMLAVLALIVRRIGRPIGKLAELMDDYAIDQDISALEVGRKDEIGRLNRSFQRMSGNIKQLFDQLDREYKVKEKYKFESLRAQLNPHFLFNTLGTIRWMALIRQAGNIVESIDALANMLKYSMNRGGDAVPLAEELANIRDYVFIQNMRYGERYEVVMDIADELQRIKVIKFILQPVVENAFIHAFEDNNGEGIIRIRGQKENGKLILCVEDNGKGMERLDSAKALDEGRGTDAKGKLTGIGLRNVEERIRVSYGEEFGLRIESKAGQGTKVIYTLPAAEGDLSDETANDRG